MGAGILPTALVNDKLVFLLGKESKYDETPGWADFGGGSETGESFMNTACREAQEELKGFLGDKKMVHKKLKRGVFEMTIQEGSYKMFVYSEVYDPLLPVYYNSNHRFLEGHVKDKKEVHKKYFEKDEIGWFTVADLKRLRNRVRPYFKEMLDKIIANEKAIYDFIRKKSRKTRKQRS
jgi:8-oxo-dGTP pyrophosphatase MutT (NUDIX family)